MAVGRRYAAPVLVMVLAVVFMSVCIGCNGSGSSDVSVGQSEVDNESETGSESFSEIGTTLDMAEESDIATEVTDDTPVSGGELEDLEDDELDEDALDALGDIYSDFIDANTALPIIP